MSEYICKICRKPLTLDYKSLVLMAAFNMPEDGGAHAECLQKSSESSGEHQTLRKLAQDAPKSNVGGNK